MNNREIVVEKNKSKVEFIEGLKEESSYTVSPIIMNGDTLGNVVIFSNNENITDIEVKLASIASNFLAKHIEE